MSRDIRNAIKYRNRLRRDIASNRMEWVTACRNVQTLIPDSKEAKWREFISSADLSSNPNKIWTTVKSLSGKSPSSIRNESLFHDGKCYTTGKARANTFMRRYASISRLHIPKTDRRKNHVRRIINAPSVLAESCTDFMPAELLLGISSMKAKAPGKDRIAPRFISALGPNALDFFLEIFNDSCTGVSPAHWRNAIIVPFL